VNRRGLEVWVQVLYDMTNAVGNILKVIFTGDEEITDSKTYLNSCVQAYSTALTSIMLVRTHIKVSDILKGTCIRLWVDKSKELRL